MLLQRQTALAGRLTTDGETALALLGAQTVFAERRAAEPVDETGAPRAADMQPAAEGAQNGRAAASEASQGAQALLEAFAALAGQNVQAGALRQEAIERELRRTRESQSVLLSARTPQNTPAGLTGAYEQTLNVAGLAAAPTQRSMAEISRFFERDARRYG